MQKTKLIWMDGKFVPWDKAKVHIMTHTLHYGGGVFEGIRFYKTNKGPAAFRLNDHVKRFYDSAKVLGLQIPYKQEKLEKAVLDLIKKNKAQAGYIRPLAFFGPDKLGPNPIGCKSHIAIIIVAFNSYLGKDKIKIKTSKYRRIDPSTTDVHAKICGHYVNSMLASMDAAKSGFQEALLLDKNGHIAEGAAENIFMVKNGKIITPKNKYILKGITRNSIIKIAKDNKIKISEENITPKRLKNADEIFLTGTAAEVTQVSQIDNKKLPEKTPITELIKTTYMDTVHGKIEKYNKWLSYV